MKTGRTMLAAIALAAVAGNASLAQHAGGKSGLGHGAAHHQSSLTVASEGATVLGRIAPNAAGESDKSAGRSPLPATINGVANKTGGEVGHNAGPQAPGTAGKTGAAVQSIDLAGPGDGYASLRRRAMRSTLIANAPKKIPMTVPPGNIVVHPPASATGEIARNAIGVTAPGSGNRNLTVAHPASGFSINGSVANGNLANATLANGNLVNGMVAKTSIGGNAGEIRHESPHPVPVVGAIPSTGLSGSAMGHTPLNAAALGGPARIVTGIGGGSMRPKY